jgi:type IV pilus assembly protein PilB
MLHAIEETMGTRELQNMLLHRGLITPSQLGEAANGSWLEGLLDAGLLDEEAMCQCVVRALHLPRCRREALGGVAAEAIDLLPADLAIEHRAVPLAVDDEGYLRVAMVDPTDTRAVLEIEFFTGHRALREVASATEVAQALRRYYGVVSPLYPTAHAAA